MLTKRIVMVDRTGRIAFDDLSEVAAALSLQVERDLSPIWGVSATVAAASSADKIPVGAWPIFVVDDLPPSEGGVHLSKHKQPFALVEAGDGWTIAASHECLEMLVDPSGNMLHPSTAIEVNGGTIRDATGKFEYLVEICDPSEDAPFSYAIDGVSVSDFYTPHYFDPSAASGVRYSFTGAITRPRDVLKNGYLSWFNPATGTLQQVKFFGAAPEIVDLGAATGASLRAHVDSRSRTTIILSKLSTNRSPKLAAAVERRRKLREASAALAKLYV